MTDICKMAPLRTLYPIIKPDLFNAQIVKLWTVNQTQYQSYCIINSVLDVAVEKFVYNILSVMGNVNLCFSFIDLHIICCKLIFFQCSLFTYVLADSKTQRINLVSYCDMVVSYSAIENTSPMPLTIFYDRNDIKAQLLAASQRLQHFCQYKMQNG